MIVMKAAQHQMNGRHLGEGDHVAKVFTCFCRRHFHTARAGMLLDPIRLIDRVFLPVWQI